MKAIVILLLLGLSAVCVTGLNQGDFQLPPDEPRSSDYFSKYEGATVWRFHPKDEIEARTLKERVEELLLDLWAATPTYIDVLIPAKGFDVRDLPSSSAPTVFVANVADRMRNQLRVASKEEVTAASSNNVPGLGVSNTSFFLSYHEYSEIYHFMVDLANQNPNLVKLISIGQTVQGNSIVGVVISRPGNSHHNKSTIFHMGCEHAREWISGATMTYLMQWLVDESKSVNDNALIDRYSWTIVPIMNVDGYLWSWSNERLWRKNRRPNNLCYGVDNNRNYGFMWGEKGSSSVQCSQTFRGEQPNSEPETLAVENYLASNDILVFGDIHAYSQLWLSPYGYSCTVEPPKKDFEMQIEFDQACVDAIFRVHDRIYTPGPICQTLYEASGASVDWAYHEQNIVLSYTAELRGPSDSKDGFLLPPEEIIPQGQEFVAAMLAMINFIDTNN